MSSLEIRLPALSATMEEATILSWLVAPGDTVSEGQAIAEVSTDKVDMELESPYAGTVQELLAEEGATVPLGGAMAMIESEADDLLGGLALGRDDAAPVPELEPEAEPEPAPEPVAAPPAGTIVPAAPAARKLARERGVDLASVTPTGARGQVTPADVEARAGMVEVPLSAPDDTKRLSVRRATADIMTRSAAIPQFAVRRQLLLDRAAGRKAGRTWTTELVRALAAALREHPELNSWWDDEARGGVAFEALRVGVAVDRPGVGLVVAAIEDPDLLEPDAADRAVRGLIDRARTGRPKRDDMAQASITISNLGGFGVDRFDALLFPPQAAILSVGSIAMRPVATSDRVLKAALACEVGLTIDHRVADGADGARLLQTFAALIET